MSATPARLPAILAIELDAFNKVFLPVCLVKTKCDLPDQPGGVGLPESLVGEPVLQTSVTASDSQKKCMAAILAMISKRNGWCLGRFHLLYFLFITKSPALLPWCLGFCLNSRTTCRIR